MKKGKKMKRSTSYIFFVMMLLLASCAPSVEQKAYEKNVRFYILPASENSQKIELNAHTRTVGGLLTILSRDGHLWYRWKSDSSGMVFEDWVGANNSVFLLKVVKGKPKLVQYNLPSPIPIQ